MALLILVVGERIGIILSIAPALLIELMYEIVTNFFALVKVLDSCSMSVSVKNSTLNSLIYCTVYSTNLERFLFNNKYLSGPTTVAEFIDP
jgi:hypothetical protein